MPEHNQQRASVNPHTVSLISSLLGIALGVYFVSCLQKEDSRTFPYNQPALPSQQPYRSHLEQPLQQPSRQQSPLEQKTSSLYEQLKQFAEQKSRYTSK